jgi:hypothetical protein
MVKFIQFEQSFNINHLGEYTKRLRLLACYICYNDL